MAVALSQQLQDYIVKIRHKVMNGNARTLNMRNGTLGASRLITDGGTWPLTSASIRALGYLAKPLDVTDDLELVLQNKHQAAEFTAGLTCTVVNWTNAATTTTCTPVAVKGEKLLLNTGVGTAMPAGSAVVQFTASNGEGAAGPDEGWAHVSAQEIAELLRLCKAHVETRATVGEPTSTLSSGTATGGSTTTVVDGASTFETDEFVGFTVTFAGNQTTALEDVTARVRSNTTTTLTVHNVNDGGVISEVLPAACAANDTYTLSFTLLDPYINALTASPVAVAADGFTASTAPSGPAANSNSNWGPIAIAGIVDALQHLNAANTADLNLNLPSNLEEMIMGSAVGMSGIYKRTHLTLPYTDATDSTLTVAPPPGLQETNLPLAGSVTVTDTGYNVDSTWGNVDTSSAAVAYTRTKGSNVLTLTGGQGAVGADKRTGAIVEMQAGVANLVAKNGYSPEVEPKVFVHLLSFLRNVIADYTVAAL